MATTIITTIPDTRSAQRLVNELIRKRPGRAAFR